MSGDGPAYDHAYSQAADEADEQRKFRKKLLDGLHHVLTSTGFGETRHRMSGFEKSDANVAAGLVAAHDLLSLLVSRDNADARAIDYRDRLVAARGHPPNKVQYLYFKARGKFYSEGWGAPIPKGTIVPVDHEFLFKLNDDSMPGLSTAGRDFAVIVLDNTSWPRYCPAKDTARE